MSNTTYVFMEECENIVTFCWKKKVPHLELCIYVDSLETV